MHPRVQSSSVYGEVQVGTHLEKCVFLFILKNKCVLFALAENSQIFIASSDQTLIRQPNHVFSIFI